ncbi:MAG: TIGR02281 family clan AA aspartic protease [Burkholderiaceae bacterium]
MARRAGRVLRALGTGLLCAALGHAAAQTVTLGGTLGDKAVLVIDGVPRTLSRGASIAGVKLLAVSNDAAEVEVANRRTTLRLGGAQLKLDPSASAGASNGHQIVMTAGSGGHFSSAGSINGQPVVFLVDTGATFIALSQSEADRLGVRYRDGQRGMAQTANGPVPVHRARLASVRIGDVQVFDVEATVVPMQMEQILLGNSFLARFQMTRENDTMTLVRRY